jgi:DNA mismatch endonuclease (patch repair protein)
MDIMTKDERSERMRRVRSKGNRSTELRFRLALVRKGIRGWRVQPDSLTGRPDFVFPEARIAIFVDGCFWHGCPVCKRPLPIANRAQWKKKIKFNIDRSRQVDQELGALGFTVLRIWEHSLRLPSDLAQFLDRLVHCLRLR